MIVSMKGRENEFRNIAIELLRRFQTEIGEVTYLSLSYISKYGIGIKCEQRVK